MAQLNFFSQIDSQKKEQIISFLLQTGNDLRIKIRDQYYKSKILKKKDDDVYSIYKFIPGNFQDQEAIFSFDGPEGKFFFRGSISTQGSDLTLKFPEEIFEMVRRSDFRVDLPPGNGYPCAVVAVNTAKKDLPTELRNISLGGCQISAPTGELEANKNDELQISLTIKDYEWPKIKTIVKQIRQGSEKGDIQLFGLQFKDPDADFLTEVQSALMYLDRTHRHRH